MSNLQSSDATHEANDKTILGFWVYLMTDIVLFGSLFATYVVLRNNTYGGPGGSEIFEMPAILVETLVLLTSSFTCGLAMLAVRRKHLPWSLFWFGFTFLLGIIFLSAFFTLVATHGLHIAIGLLWLLVMGWQIVRHGFTNGVVRRLTLFSIFWHFLDIIWIFIFTVV